MADDAQGQEGTSTVEYEKPTSFAEAFDPKIKIEPEESELSTGFLKGLPVEDAEKLAPYVKQWDSNVTKLLAKRDAEFQAKFSPYEGLDAVDAKDALELRELIQTNPKAAMTYLNQLIDSGEISQEEAQEIVDETSSDDILSQLPPEVRDRLLEVDKLKEGYTQLYNEKQATAAAAQEASEMADFAKTLEDLDTKYTKEFGTKADRDLVLRLIATNVDPDDAFKMYHELVNNATQEKMKAHSAAPLVLGNGAIVPADNVPIGKMSAKDRKSLVNQMLNKGNT